MGMFPCSCLCMQTQGHWYMKLFFMNSSCHGPRGSPGAAATRSRSIHVYTGVQTPGQVAQVQDRNAGKDQGIGGTGICILMSAM